MKNITVHVHGMHCTSCEMLLKHDFKKIKGVDVHDISHKKGTIDLSYVDEASLKQVHSIIKERGYEVLENEEAAKSKKKHANTLTDYIEMFLIVAIFGIVAWILDEAKLYQYFPSVGEDAGVIVSLLLGLVASVSTCLALVGGIVVSFGSTYKIAPDHKHPLLAHAKPHLLFHLGRFVTFVVLGGLLGLVGSLFNLSLGFTSYLTFLIGIVMLYIGLQILDIVPNITTLGFHMPKRFSSKFGALQEAEHASAPLLLGGITFFLPCGFTQGVQLSAIASGSFVSGAMMTGAFALGTFPVLLGIGIGSSYAKDIKAKTFKRFIGILILIFGLYSLNNGLRLYGVGFDPFQSPSTDAPNKVVISEDGYQEIYMTANWTFEPSNFVIQKDIPVRWIIDGQNVSGCISELVIPELGLDFNLEKGENIIEFTPTEVGDMSFSCWMGMVGGNFTVVE